jgi:putative aldouronate transport system permease protein
MKRNRGEFAFQAVDAFFMTVVVLLVILPFMHIASISVSSSKAVSSLSVGIFPKGFNLSAYIEILKQGIFIRSLANTVLITVLATVLSLTVNVMAAYGFSKEFYAKKPVTYAFVITMYFSGGLVPSYILITKWLHLNNSYLAFFLPSLVNVFYIIIIRSQIEAVPASLSEAAIIDGASEYQVLLHITIPAISATIAAIGMFTALAMWNIWYPVMLYSNKREMWTLQYFLRAVVFEKYIEYMPNSSVSAVSDAESASPMNFQNAAIILVALPIVSIYPFVQKYFVKGILAGSVKG